MIYIPSVDKTYIIPVLQQCIRQFLFGFGLSEQALIYDIDETDGNHNVTHDYYTKKLDGNKELVEFSYIEDASVNKKPLSQVPVFSDPTVGLQVTSETTTTSFNLNLTIKTLSRNRIKFIRKNLRKKLLSESSTLVSAVGSYRIPDETIELVMNVADIITTQLPGSFPNPESYLNYTGGSVGLTKDKRDVVSLIIIDNQDGIDIKIDNTESLPEIAYDDVTHIHSLDVSLTIDMKIPLGIEQSVDSMIYGQLIDEENLPKNSWIDSLELTFSREQIVPAIIAYKEFYPAETTLNIDDDGYIVEIPEIYIGGTSKIIDLTSIVYEWEEYEIVDDVVKSGFFEGRELDTFEDEFGITKTDKSIVINETYYGGELNGWVRGNDIGGIIIGDYVLQGVMHGKDLIGENFENVTGTLNEFRIIMDGPFEGLNALVERNVLGDAVVQMATSIRSFKYLENMEYVNRYISVPYFIPFNKKVTKFQDFIPLLAITATIEEEGGYVLFNLSELGMYAINSMFLEDNSSKTRNPFVYLQHVLFMRCYFNGRWVSPDDFYVDWTTLDVKSKIPLRTNATYTVTIDIMENFIRLNERYETEEVKILISKLIDHKMLLVFFRDEVSEDKARIDLNKLLLNGFMGKDTSIHTLKIRTHYHFFENPNYIRNITRIPR